MASFNYVINNGVMRGELISDNKTTFSKEFVMCLLRTRYLFDRYIIKKDDKGEESSEKWSLKTIKKTPTAVFGIIYKNHSLIRE